jgi:hypothetical protein
MTKRNPKQEGSNVFDCKPQSGLCPMNCAECFYNRPGAFYVDPEKPHMPTVEEVGDGILRVNSGHDSNSERDMVIAATDAFPRRFFNTSIPKFDFPAPVVFTANRKEEEPAWWPCSVVDIANVMFVRLRVSSTNLAHVYDAIGRWANKGVPVVLTFMAYYTAEPTEPDEVSASMLGLPCYVWKQRHVNSYWCATPEFISLVMYQARAIGGRGRLVTLCGTLESNYCRDCRNCETYYWQAVKRLGGS